jgi:hypothetical protein
MLLDHRSWTISVAFGTVSFFMVDDGKTVRVDVPQDMLARTEGSPPVSKDQLVERLIRYRQHFAQIAGVKYDDGQFEEEVNVLVVRITGDDLPAAGTD